MSSPFFTFASARRFNYIFATELSGSSMHIQIRPGSWPETMDKWLSGGGVTTLPLLYEGPNGGRQYFFWYVFSFGAWLAFGSAVCWSSARGMCVDLMRRLDFGRYATLGEVFFFPITVGLSGLVDVKFWDLCLDVWIGQVSRAVSLLLKKKKNSFMLTRKHFNVYDVYCGARVKKLTNKKTGSHTMARYLKTLLRSQYNKT